jgi:hypothetical protein
VTIVYGPIAAMLAGLFPTRIRYSGLSLPYHIGNGWFGGLMPAPPSRSRRRPGTPTCAWEAAPRSHFPPGTTRGDSS